MLAIKYCRSILICMESSKVLLPRFERELPAEGPVNERELQTIADPRHWMVEHQFKDLLSPETVTGVTRSRGKRAKQDWWGLRHSAVEKTSLGLLIDESGVDLPFQDSMKLYRYRVVEHDYQWDHQAVSGNCSEVVLERLTLGVGFKEVMAIMAGRGHDHKGKQSLVMLGQGGEMNEPDFVNVSKDEVRRFYLGTLALLSKAGYDDLDGADLHKPSY